VSDSFLTRKPSVTPAHSQKLAEVYMPELEEVKTRLNLSRPFEELPTKSHYSHAQRDAGSVQVCTPIVCQHVPEPHVDSVHHCADNATIKLC